MQYYRPNSGIPPAVKTLIIINVVMYLLTLLLARITEPPIQLTRILGLYLPGSDHWGIWQYVTHMFMHGNFSHLFFNMFALFMFGRILESVWGSKRFLIFYFVCGIGAALFNSLIGGIDVLHMHRLFEAFQAAPDAGTLAEFMRSHPLDPMSTQRVDILIDQWFSDEKNPAYIVQGTAYFEQIMRLYTNIPMVGASGAIFGILLAFGMLFPNTELFLFFVPVPIKAKYFVLGYGFLELWLGFQNNPGDNVAHFAHLGGMIFGFFLVRYWNKHRKTFY